MNASDNGLDLGKLADEEIKGGEIGYPDYGLVENPFPVSAIATKARLFLDTGSKFRKRTFEEIGRRIVHTARTSRYRGMVLLGDFGLGKTHTLYYFAEIINRQLGDKQGVKSLALYLSSPGSTLYDFLSNFLQEIGVDFILSTIYAADPGSVVDLVVNFWRKRLERLKVPGQTYSYYPPPNLPKAEELLHSFEAPTDKRPDLDSLRIASRNLGGALESSYLYGYGSASSQLLICRGISKMLLDGRVFSLEDYSYCMSILMLASTLDYRRIATKYITGQKLLASEVKLLGLTSKQLSTSDISKRVFPDILKILHEMGEHYNMIFVFIDEFEKIVLGIKGAKRFEFLEDLRNLIDYNLTRFSLILGCSTEAYDTIKSTSPAFADRNRDLIDLPRVHDVEEVKNLIEPFIRERRMADFRGDRVHPFTDDSLLLISDQEKGSPRYILEACHKLLNYGLKEESKDIGVDLVRNWYGISE